MLTYDEICRDPAATPQQRETALLREWLASLREITRLRGYLATIRDTGLTAGGAAEHAADALAPNF